MVTTFPLLPRKTSFISEEITAYRRQIDERKNDLPLWERKVLTCDEAAAYSGIGIAFKVEKVKKDNDVQTYKEIVAFSEGKLLDDIHKQREIGKRPYQKILLVIGTALTTFVVCVLIGFLMHILLN